MNRRWLLAFCILSTSLASLSGLVLIPQQQLGALKPVVTPDGAQYPEEPSGGVAAGRQVYRDLGCIYCHSQQIRAASFGADIDRGWGRRRSVARDLLFAGPPLLGTMRTGPDLANISNRQPSREWHHRHLYRPASLSPGSIMPPFEFLYDVVSKPDGSTAEAFLIKETGAYLVPKQRAIYLVDYLLSLDQSFPLPEAK